MKVTLEERARVVIEIEGVEIEVAGTGWEVDGLDFTVRRGTENLLAVDSSMLPYRDIPSTWELTK